ncbi:MAG: hypothetical protein CHACPFDD_03035 [Phycisphaerae bacterium]|nr:hypothetical protein [Phycisphaerae bacterium]
MWSGEVDKCDMPRFSIVIPTRNRAQLLRHALRSACGQEHDDFEVVVSLNGCTDESERVVSECRPLGHTSGLRTGPLGCRAAEVASGRHGVRDGDATVRGAGGARVRVVRTPRPMPVHEHWDFALRAARGEYVTLLCDDDALHPAALRAVERVLEARGADVVCWSFVVYHHPHGAAGAARNALDGGVYTNRWYEVGADEALHAAYGLRLDERPLLPVAIRSAWRRGVHQSLCDRFGNIFTSTAPDYSAMALLLSAVDSYVWLDAPLMIGGVAPESIGASAVANGGAFRQHVDETATADGWTARVPLRQETSANGIAEALLAARERCAALRGYELDWGMYYARCGQMLELRARCGVDVSAERAELSAALANGNAECRMQSAEARLRGAWPPRADATAVATEGRRYGAWLRRADATVRGHGGPTLRPWPGGDDDTAVAREGRRYGAWPRSADATDVVDGLGSFCVPPLEGGAEGFGDIAACAEVLGEARCCVSLEEIAERVVDRARRGVAGLERVVLFGLGRNGSAILPTVRRRVEEAGAALEVFDDDAGARMGGEVWASLPARREEWSGTFVFVTPWRDETLGARLVEAGGVEGRDWTSWRRVVDEARSAGGASERPADVCVAEVATCGREPRA